MKSHIFGICSQKCRGLKVEISTRHHNIFCRSRDFKRDEYLEHILQINIYSSGNRQNSGRRAGCRAGSAPRAGAGARGTAPAHRQHPDWEVPGTIRRVVLAVVSIQLAGSRVAE